MKTIEKTKDVDSTVKKGANLQMKIADFTRGLQNSTHHLGISYYVKFLGHLGSNGFQLN